MSFYERHGVVRAVQWNRHGDHPHVGPGVRESGGMLHINVALPYARRHVEPGDWIVTEGDGKSNVLTDAEFRHNFKGL